MANTKVQSEQIEDGSITADKLADGTIVAAELANNAVVTAAINADAVTGAKIADDAIDSEHYTDGSIDTAHIADSQITVGKMAANSVDSDQYVDGSIDTVHIADLQVTTAKIANGNISTAKIADNAVTSAKIDTNIDIAGTFDVTGATVLDSTLSVAGISTLNVSAIIKSAGTNDTPADLSFWHTDASIASGDDIAVISAEGSDSGGSPPYQGAKITFDADANWDTGTSNYYPTNINFFTQDNSGTDTIAAGSRLTIQSDGNVGIGETSPDALLHLKGATATNEASHILFENTQGTKKFAIGAGTSGVTNNNFVVRNVTDSTFPLVITDAGNVGIGTTSPSRVLHTQGASVLFGNTSGAHEILFGDSAHRYFKLYTPSSPDYASIRTGTTDILVAHSDGKVGIGTTSPNALLTVGSTGTSGPELQIMSSTSGSGYLYFGDGTSGTARYDGYIGYNQTSRYMAFATGGGAERMRITSGGVLSIGDSSPESGDADAVKCLYLQGADSVMVLKQTAANSSSQRQGICFLNSSGTRVGTIAVRNTGTDYITSSDYRLKENVKPLPNGLDRLNALKPVQFNWKVDSSTSEGFLAHEVEEVFPYAVMGKKDGTAMQAMDYGRITPLLVKAIQEQQTIIEAQTTSINDLKTRIEALES